MKESTARIGDTHSLTHDRTVSECFPCRWPEINKYMHTIIFVLSYFFVSRAGGERHLNFNWINQGTLNSLDK